MTASPDEIERRRNAAIDAIRRAHGTADDEHGATIFVSHHLDEIGDDYWIKHCGAARPDAGSRHPRVAIPLGRGRR